MFNIKKSTLSLAPTSVYAFITPQKFYVVHLWIKLRIWKNMEKLSTFFSTLFTTGLFLSIYKVFQSDLCIYECYILFLLLGKRSNFLWLKHFHFSYRNWTFLDSDLVPFCCSINIFLRPATIVAIAPRHVCYFEMIILTFFIDNCLIECIHWI